LKSILLKERAL